MANIAGTSFGQLQCDHMVRRFVVLHFDVVIGFYIDLPVPVDISSGTILMFVNNDPFSSAVGVVSPDNTHRVTFATLGGSFGIGGFGQGGFGQGGFNVGINIADLGNYPVDDVELQFKTLPDFCPKCILLDDTGAPQVTLGQGVGFGRSGFGSGGWGQ